MKKRPPQGARALWTCRPVISRGGRGRNQLPAGYGQVANAWVSVIAGAALPRGLS